MSVTYIHYGADKFDKSKVKPVKNRESWGKPYGGMWASREDDPAGWKVWCEDNDFHTDSLHTYFTFTLKPGANVYEITSIEDVYKLPLLTNPKRYAGCTEYVDFEKCFSMGIDAIEVTNIDPVYMTLYGWDCNSILIMNPNVVEEVLQ